MITVEELIGTWKIVSYTLMDKDGNITYPLGRECKAYLIYTADSHVTVQISSLERKPYASGDLHTGTIEEMAEAAHTYVAYTGTYTLKPEKSEVIHNIELSMNPCWENQPQIRKLDYDGEFLRITAPVNGGCLIWKKVSYEEKSVNTNSL